MPQLSRVSTKRSTAAADSGQCKRCGSAARLGNGICIHCLLHEASRGGDEVSAEELARALAEDDLPDRDWRFGNYDILNELARGGMGVIYRARQRHSGRIVALKRVLSTRANDREWIERFRREIQAAASLDHPNVLPIYEVGEDEEGLPYFSMKLATGGSLRDVAPTLAGKTRECVRLIVKVARAVERAHTQGILHRDLQPGNILIDGNGEPLVSDFGLAKYLDAANDLTQTLTTFGTPGFIAPEQAEAGAHESATAADIYGLGALLFYLLTQRPPFTGRNALAIIQQAATTSAPKLRSLAPALDRDLETICAHSLEAEPAARYLSARAFAEDLERWLERKPIKARRISPPAHLWRWSRRNPVLSTIAAACLLLVAAVAWLGAVLSSSKALGAPSEKSVAVLPFDNLSTEAKDAFFVNGVQEEILTKLGKISDLRLIGPSSVREYPANAPRNLREIARTLGVRHILEGSVRRSDNRVRVSVRLSDAHNRTQVWAQQFESDLRDVFEVQGEVASDVAKQLRSQLTPSEQATIRSRPTSDAVAYDLFLQAKEISREVWPDEDRMRQEVTLLDQAIARDRSFLPALCAVARAHLRLYWFNHDHSAARLALATKAVDDAARLQPDAGDVHLARAILHYWGHRDYPSALRELTNARQSLPNDSEIPYFIALISRRLNNWEEAGSQLEQASALDPRNVRIVFDLFSTYRETKHYAEAARVCERILKWEPNNTRVQGELADIERARSANLEPFRAFATRQMHGKISPEESASMRVMLAVYDRDYRTAMNALMEFPMPDFRQGGFVTPKEVSEGSIARHLGDDGRADAALTKAMEKVNAFLTLRPDDAQARLVLGDILAKLGRKEEAIREGEQAVALRRLESDGMEGPVMLTGLAAIYAQVGEVAHALDLLNIVTKLPMGPHYGDLVLDDFWDNLRAQPRFAELLQSLAPADIRK